MRIKTMGETLKDEVKFSALFSQAAADQSVREFERDGKVQVKLAPDGRPVYRTALKALRVVDGQVIGEERNVSLAVIAPVDIAAGKIYAAAGITWITPYEANGRVALSIIAETVKEVPQGLTKTNPGV